MDKIPSKILIVDDKKTNRDLLRIFLSKAEEQYVFLEADSGVAALELVERERPDIILLDVVMPDMDGFEVCQKLKANEKHRAIPVLFITALDKTEDLVKCFSVGAADYIPKPVKAEEVKARVRTHLRIKKAEEDRLQVTNLQAVKNMVVTYNHNMNQPLMASITYLELLLALTPEDDKRRKSLLKIKSELGKVTDILKKIQELEQLKSVDYVGNIQMIDLGK
ncbi:MAG: response regulator [Candidatus Omnitrophica bacterium]|nr:response regulator [Candidatus Omnitrophota bacterium]